ncbi:proline iminopeptidase-like isoform X1 [Zingiber officinale]|uniref:proline iminopeptidase-like isoform X1 n=1 Tax=Zingiber officinale TaxID=94328 RepID=UPI001C4AE9CF|nr:proline iminopeptidase-like isoform X1 [Zingiber officinale]
MRLTGLQIPNSTCIAKFATTVAGAGTAASASLVRPPRPRQVRISTPLSFRYIYHSLSPTLRTKKPLLGGYKILVCAEKSSTPVVQQYTFMGSSKEPQEYNSNLYPHIEPYSTGFLKVSDIHTLYWEQSGNPNGHPVVFLHGGPGAGTSASNRRFFDPEFYRIILLDQRGAGKSTPHACLVDNTTWDLIGDIEKLREHLGIPEWQVFGGSWGSTLALAYSQLHPDKVTGIILRGIFLLRKKELDWFYEGGAAAIFPDAWEPFRDFIPEEERDNFILAYNKRLNSDDLDVQIKAAKIWTTWELMTAHLLQNQENVKRGEDDIFSLAFARIENHYFINKGFLPSGSYILDNVDKIRHIRTVIVQGRYDVCCPMMSAWDLHKAWPEAEFKVIPDAGHSANEPGIAAALVAANEKFKNLIRSGAP